MITAGPITGLCAPAAFALAFSFLVLAVQPVRSAEKTDGTSEAIPGEGNFIAAQNAARSGDYKTASNEYAKLMLLEPENVDYVFGYAQVLYWSDDPNQALLYLRQARAMAPDYEAIWKLEYQILDVQAQGKANPTLDHFRDLARTQFPEAEWLVEHETTTQNRFRWAFNATRDYLDNGAPDWQQVDLSIGHIVGQKSLVSFSAGASQRFGLSDTRFAFELSTSPGANWTTSASVALSSSPSFLAKEEATIDLSRRLGAGWVGGTRWRRRNYESASVNTIGLVVERYVGNYRFAYAPSRASLFADSAIVHAFTSSFYSKSGTQLNLTFASGEEIEAVAPGQILKTSVRSGAVSGRHPVNDYLSVGWRIGWHQQGALYRRSTIGVSLSGGF